MKGGDETRVLASILDYNFAPASRGIYFLDGTPSDAYLHLRYLPFATHAIQTVGMVRGAVSDEMAVSGDKRWSVFGTVRGAGSDLMLVENFH